LLVGVVMATSAEAAVPPPPLCPPHPPQNSLLTLLAFAPDSESVSATRISLMASFQVFFVPPPLAIAQD
jgi:hypothetical protein